MPPATGSKLARLLSSLAGGAPVTIHNATSGPATSAYPVCARGAVNVLDIYQLGRDQVLSLYQQTSASAEEVGAALKDTFGVAAPAESAKVLQAAGYTARRPSH